MGVRVHCLDLWFEDVGVRFPNVVVGSSFCFGRGVHVLDHLGVWICDMVAHILSSIHKLSTKTRRTFWGRITVFWGSKLGSP